MKKILFLFISILMLTGGIYVAKYCISQKSTKTILKDIQKDDTFKNGDIIFQTSLSNQSKAIQLATRSKYSHCGIIYKEGNSFYVFEAVQPVKTTRLDKWIARGKNSHFVVKR